MALSFIPEHSKPEQGVKEWVYQSLRQALMCGRIEPGLPLTIRGLAQTLEVSPTPVREALYRLTCEGAVQVKDNRRVIVPEMTAGKLQALFDLRIVLETHAACAALPLVTEQHLAALEQLDAVVDSAVASADIERITQANQAFHRYLYTLPPEQVVMPMIESAWLQLGPFVRVVLSKLEQCYPVDRHQEALAALRAQDESALQQAIAADIRDGMTSIAALDGVEAWLG
ncbi:MAG: GntR family transcriptional regulator [Thiolinea sp.]